MVLCLGTVQLGLHYGINNRVGMLTDEQAFAVLDAAYEVGFRAVDTAPAYGESERRIGEWLRKTGADVEVITKETPGKDTRLRSKAILSRVDTLLYHCIGYDVRELFPGTADGISVYTPAEVSAGIKFKTFQVPASIADGRMDETIAMLKREGKRVMVRSLLLQGKVAGDPIVVQTAIRWIYELDPDVAIVGAETPEQVRQIADYYSRGPLPKQVVEFNKKMREGVPEKEISPRMWGQSYDFT
jgi:aryl-alcohol dehydrogenase-like predicted oxidoreductase